MPEPQQTTEPAMPAGSDSHELEQIEAHSGTAVAVTLDVVGGTLTQSDLLLGHLGLSAATSGLAGESFPMDSSSLDGLSIVEVWQTRRHFDYFLARETFPAIDRLRMPIPDVTTAEVHSYLTQVPTVAIDSEDVCGDAGSRLR